MNSQITQLNSSSAHAIPAEVEAKLKELERIARQLPHQFYPTVFHYLWSNVVAFQVTAHVVGTSEQKLVFNHDIDLLAHSATAKLDKAIADCSELTHKTQLAS